MSTAGLVVSSGPLLEVSLRGPVATVRVRSNTGQRPTQIQLHGSSGLLARWGVPRGEGPLDVTLHKTLKPNVNWVSASANRPSAQPPIFAYTGQLTKINSRD